MLALKILNGKGNTKEKLWKMSLLERITADSDDICVVDILSKTPQQRNLAVQTVCQGALIKRCDTRKNWDTCGSIGA